MTEEDIKKQLEVKNIEIFKNKLKLDINNNMEGLVLTIENLINKLINESTNRILGIAESFSYKEEIEKDIEEYFSKYLDCLMELLDKKRNNILKSINLNVNYEDCFDKETNNILVKLNEFYDNNVDNLVKKIQGYYDDSFCKERINNYLKNNLKENVDIKIIETIKGRDIILLNTFKETNIKFIELNKNTIG